MQKDLDKNIEYEQINKIVGNNDVKYNEPMSKHSSFKVGGNADIFITVDSKEKLEKILELNSKLKLPITIVGNGTNLLVKDNGLRGIVIKYTAETINTSLSEKSTDKTNDKANDSVNITLNDLNEVNVESGILNGKLAQILLQNELSGFEFASGIPGTLGGAINMNAGAFGSEMKDIVKDVTYLDLREIKIYTVENKKCNFEYRNSIFNNNNIIILNSTLILKKSNKDEIQNKMNEYRTKRMETQPLDMPSAGSTFKRGKDFVTAKLIDEAGLKGYRIGGAEVSTKHAGFIVNKDNASADDIIKLIKYVQETVFEKYGKKIETEVRIVGE